MRLTAGNFTSVAEVDKSSFTDNIVIITVSTWLFVIFCLLLIFYYHWQVCQYIGARTGNRQNNFLSNFYLKPSRKRR